MSYLQLNHDPARALLLASSGRSGSTWLSDVVADAFGCRVLFEPLRPKRLRPPKATLWGYYVDPAVPDAGLEASFGRILAGRVRDEWVNRFNTRRISRNRLVKEIRATNLLPWVIAHFQNVPVVYLLRHPVSVALSATALGWDPCLDDFLGQQALMGGPLLRHAQVAVRLAGSTDLFERHVLRWCLENVVPVELLPSGSVHVVFYEALVEDPDREFDRLLTFLRRYGAGGWDAPVVSRPVFERASITNLLGTAITLGPEALNAWPPAATHERIDRAVAIAAEFGLDRIYGASPRPRINPADVLRRPSAD